MALREITTIFTKNQSKAVKGLFAMVVLFHHIWQKVLLGQDIAFVDYFFRSLGPIAVGVFLFISGYGLYKSLTISKSIDGGGNVLIYRVLPILSINIVVVIAYSIVRFILLGEFSFMESFRSIAFGGEVVIAGWYLQVIVWFYSAFIVIYHKSQRHLISILTLMIVVYMISCYFKGIHSWWYISSLAFPLGVFISKYSDRITLLLRNKGKLIVLSSYLIFIVLYMVRFFIKPIGVNFILNFILSLCLPLSVAVFAFVMYLTTSYVTCKSNVLRFLGNYFLEIYVLQGIVFISLHNRYWALTNQWLYIVTSLGGTLLIAYIAKPFFTYIKNKTRIFAIKIGDVLGESMYKDSLK